MTRMLSLCLTFLFALPPCITRSEVKQPNILFIMVDDLGKDWIGCYGADNIETPHIDGLALEEPYLTTQDRSNMTPMLLAEGEYFVMGDNRSRSNDSRTWGAVPEGNILGKVWVVYWPFGQAQILDAASSFTGGLFTRGLFTRDLFPW